MNFRRYSIAGALRYFTSLSSGAARIGTRRRNCGRHSEKPPGLSDFFALWKDADTDIPILMEAKQEYEKLK
jgi:hypothetical protein